MSVPVHAPSSRGLIYASLLLGAWAGLHTAALFAYDWRPLWVAPLLVAALTWVYVGLFIVAHDAIHGTLAPGRPWLNRWVGRVCLFLFAAFSFDALAPKHHLHHERAGTADDPDFDARPPHHFWAWYGKFFLEYFGWRQCVWLTIVNLGYLALGAPLPNLIVFWAVPPIIGSLQLFTFGTWLPHRPDAGGAAFADAHRARSNDLPVWLSLLTCFHFGYHHEHHLYPAAPWWRLPAVRAARRDGEL